MNINNSIYGSSFDPDVIRELNKIDEKIKENDESPEYDSQKAMKLRMAKLLKGLELTSGLYGFGRNRGIPY